MVVLLLLEVVVPVALVAAVLVAVAVVVVAVVAVVVVVVVVAVVFARWLPVRVARSESCELFRRSNARVPSNWCV